MSNKFEERKEQMWSEKPLKIHDWNWVLEQIQRGNKVYKESWGCDLYLSIVNGTVTLSKDECRLCVSDYQATDWKIWEEKLYLSDLKKGDRFVFKDTIGIFQVLSIDITHLYEYHRMHYSLSYSDSNGDIWFITRQNAKRKEVVKLS